MINLMRSCIRANEVTIKCNLSTRLERFLFEVGRKVSKLALHQGEIETIGISMLQA
jgi:hypothetical protein